MRQLILRALDVYPAPESSLGTQTSTAFDSMTEEQRHNIAAALLATTPAQPHIFSVNANWREAIGFAAALANWLALNKIADENGASDPFGSEEEIRAQLFIEQAIEAYRTLADPFALKIQGIDGEHALIDSRHFHLVMDIGCTIWLGLSWDLVAFRGFNSIDDYDFRDWLDQHGAKHETLHSAVVNPGYDYAFAYKNGDTSIDGKLAAGAAINAFLRLLLGYKGALFYEMQASMGEVVFTPLYDVLHQRGVRFEFFQRVDGLNVAESAEGPFIESVEIGVQAVAKDQGGYDPIIDIQVADQVYRCWPSQPKTGELEPGELTACFESGRAPAWDQITDHTIELKAGEDYDAIILAIPIGEIPRICPQLIERSPDWRQMVDKVQTVATMSLQLWMNESSNELGRSGPATILTSFDQPLNTWSDMSHLIPVENLGAKSIAYFCGPLQEAAPRQGQTAPRADPVAVVRAWKGHLGSIWPELPEGPPGNAAAPPGPDDLGIPGVLLAIFAHQQQWVRSIRIVASWQHLVPAAPRRIGIYKSLSRRRLDAFGVQHRLPRGRSNVRASGSGRNYRRRRWRCSYRHRLRDRRCRRRCGSGRCDDCRSRYRSGR